LVDQGELLRWLSESTWFPTYLLASEKLQWTANGLLAKLTFNYEQKYADRKKEILVVQNLI